MDHYLMFINTNVPYAACDSTQRASRETIHMGTDIHFSEADEAGNVNNAMTVQSFENSDLSEPREPSDSNRDAESSTKPASDDSKSPSLGLDGVGNSDEELVSSLRKEVTVEENTMAEFHGANDDIEPDDSGRQKDGQCDRKAHDASDAFVTSPVPATKPALGEDAAAENRDREPGAARNAPAEIRDLPADKATKVQNGEGRALSQKPSVSTFSARDGQKDQKDFWLIQFCRVVVHRVVGVVGSMSTLLCGKRRQ
jgi:hypothetical protein